MNFLKSYNFLMMAFVYARSFIHNRFTAELAPVLFIYLFVFVVVSRIIITSILFSKSLHVRILPQTIIYLTMCQTTGLISYKVLFICICSQQYFNYSSFPMAFIECNFPGDTAWFSKLVSIHFNLFHFKNFWYSMQFTIYIID